MKKVMLVLAVSVLAANVFAQSAKTPSGTSSQVTAVKHAPAPAKTTQQAPKQSMQVVQNEKPVVKTNSPTTNVANQNVPAQQNNLGVKSETNSSSVKPAKSDQKQTKAVVKKHTAPIKFVNSKQVTSYPAVVSKSEDKK